MNYHTESVSVKRAVQKCLAVFFVLILPGMSVPVLAGDLVNTKLLQSNFPASIAGSAAFEPKAALAPLQGNLAFGMPQNTPPPSSNNSSGDSVSAFRKWGGITFMAAGGGLVAGGASISDPCKGLSGPYVSCTSNYTSVRTSAFIIGGATAAVGAWLFMTRHIKN